MSRISKRTLIVEVAVGPGGGKSTAAADLYASLKRRHLSVELAHEYVKRWAWEDRAVSSLDEYYICGKQIHEESSLLGKVDVVVADRPVCFSEVFAELYAPAEVYNGVAAMVRNYYEATAAAGHRRVAVLLPRSRGYRTEGRFEAEEAARMIDLAIEGMYGEMTSTLDSFYGDDVLDPRPRSLGFVGVYKLDDAATSFCDGSDVAVDVDRWVRRRRRRGRLE